jgi:hypothetical protein
MESNGMFLSCIETEPVAYAAELYTIRVSSAAIAHTYGKDKLKLEDDCVLECCYV